MSIKIATWNVNSLRVRLAHLLEWLAAVQPDIVALQETKLENKDFPVAELEKAGYHVIYNGQKTYNGVAILSRLPTPITDIVTAIPLLDPLQQRSLAITVGKLRIINLYVPNGASVDS